MIGMKDRTREMIGIVMLSSLMCVGLGDPASEGAGLLSPHVSFYMQNQPVVDLAYKQVFLTRRGPQAPQSGRHAWPGGVSVLPCRPVGHHDGCIPRREAMVLADCGAEHACDHVDTNRRRPSPERRSGRRGVVLCAAATIRLRKLLPKKRMRTLPQRPITARWPSKRPDPAGAVAACTPFH